MIGYTLIRATVKSISTIQRVLSSRILSQKKGAVLSVAATVRIDSCHFVLAGAGEVDREQLN